MRITVLINILIIFLFASCSEELMSPMEAPSRMKISPEQASMKKGETRKFTVVAYDQNQNLLNIDADWSVTGDIGFVNSKGYLHIYNDIRPPFPKTGYLIAKYQGTSTSIPVKINVGDYWILSDLNVHDFVYDRPNPPYDHGGKLLLDGDGNHHEGTLYEDYSEYPPIAGNIKSLRFKLMPTSPQTNYAGAFWAFGRETGVFNYTNENLSIYAENNLKFWIKTAYDVKIMIQDYNNTKFERLLSVLKPGFNFNNVWQEVEIPLGTFSSAGTGTVDFSKLKVLVSFWIDTATGVLPRISAGNSIWLDEICFTSE